MPLGILKVVVEPTEKDLLWGQAQELLKGLILFQKTVKLGVQLDINLTQQTTSNDLPNKTQNQVLTNFNDISTSDVDNGAADGLGGGDDDVVVLCDLERVQRFARGGLVQHTHVNSVRYGIVDQFAQDQAVAGLIEELHRVRGDRDA